MSRPLPVNLLMSGTGTVLLVSGIGGKSIGEVLRGSFGKLKVNPNAGSGNPTAVAASFMSEGESPEGGRSNFAPSPVSFSSATVAPPPSSFSNKQPTKQQQAKAIAAILLSEGILNPTHEQILRARERYEHETGVREVEHPATVEEQSGVSV